MTISRDARTATNTKLATPSSRRTVFAGKRAITIDEVPLEWCLQPAVKLDFRDFPNGYVASARDVETELDRIGHTLAPLEIVLLPEEGRERVWHATGKRVRESGTE